MKYIHIFIYSLVDYAKKNYSHLDRVNSADFSTDLKNGRFFVIKSYNEEDVHKSMKYQVWSSTYEGNKRLNDVYMKCQAEKIPVFLFFSVNASGQFVGVCKMLSEVTFGEKLAHWAQTEKWPGKFKVEWVFVKDVPNKDLKNILVPENDNKPVTNSRDTQQVPFESGKKMLEIFKAKKQESSLLDEFEAYDNEERKKKEGKIQGESFGKIVPDSKGQHRRGRGRGMREGKKSPAKVEDAKVEAATQPAAGSVPPTINNP